MKFLTLTGLERGAAGGSPLGVGLGAQGREEGAGSEPAEGAGRRPVGCPPGPAPGPGRSRDPSDAAEGPAGLPEVGSGQA